MVWKPEARGGGGSEEVTGLGSHGAAAASWAAWRSPRPCRRRAGRGCVSAGNPEKQQLFRLIGAEQTSPPEQAGSECGGQTAAGAETVVGVGCGRENWKWVS